MDHFGKSMNDLASRVAGLQKRQDSQKRRLVDTREEIRRQLEQQEVSYLHPKNIFCLTKFLSFYVWTNALLLTYTCFLFLRIVQFYPFVLSFTLVFLCVFILVSACICVSKSKYLVFRHASVLFLTVCS
ncbi:unnamed protein product [Protopolystoma xenopodis]|uniref:Uncharacterized protein n=1 Tax=Protopolystoma xenopodis TaxID=117903 RepID=A0A448X5L5_9PLAT|nr:unnamed protein product [Protopolystoma xenopodis]